MARRRSVLLVLLATLAVGCSTSEGGTAVVGTLPASSSAASFTAPPSSTPLSPAESSTPAPSTSPPTTAPLSSAPSTAASISTASISTASTTAASISTASTTAASTVTSPVTSTVASTPTMSSAAPTSTPNPTTVISTTTSTTALAAAFPLCPTASPTDARAMVACLRTSLSTFWSGQLNEVVDQPVIVAPTTAQVPGQCRSAITTTSAFTCQINNTVYLNTGLVDSAEQDFAPAEVPYVFATVMGHEIGHVVQAAVKQPGYADTGSSEQVSQRIEQQADCLDGVWAHSVIAARQLDQAIFVRVTNTFLTTISTNPEIAGHGTPPQRAAALAKGLKNGRPQDCGLATFS